MGNYVGFPINQAAQKIAILDSNLLILAISSRIGLNKLQSFGRIKQFVPEDALLLDWIIAKFGSVVTTAYVLAEVSNLANKLSGNLRDEWFTELAQYALVTDEAHFPTQRLGNLPETVRFGISDSALGALSEQFVLITMEHRLSGYLEKQGREVINFNHLRFFQLPI